MYGAGGFKQMRHDAPQMVRPQMPRVMLQYIAGFQFTGPTLQAAAASQPTTVARLSTVPQLKAQIIRGGCTSAQLTSQL